jgi:hypothetical protein
MTTPTYDQTSTDLAEPLRLDDILDLSKVSAHIEQMELCKRNLNPESHSYGLLNRNIRALRKLVCACQEYRHFTSNV